MSDFNDLTAPPPAPAGTPSQDDRTFALLIHLSGILLGFLVPLVVWVVKKDEPDKAFITDQAKEALNFQLTVLIALVLCSVLSNLVGVALYSVVWLVNVVLCIVAGVKANEGIAYRYPFALRLIK